MKVNQTIFDELWNGEKNICFFVCSGKSFWVVDEKYNFTLDAEKDYRAYLDAGSISQEQYELACKAFRGGVLKMTADNFPKYLHDSSEKILSSHDLQDFIGADAEVFKRVEHYYQTGEGLTPDVYKRANVISSRFPSFYINFDRKIFMHMDDVRVHEDLVEPGWTAENADFSFLIPASERYWVVAGNDYWKLRFV
ncbi:hypothetical protein [Pseudomonas allokribbensis]|uniref:hypothetical protein n=1 Tax=Pseudomonas allokribbensis TaxID=2774460 RepID=UPI00178863D1|nr:hypothetical protein [Pseudomonas allokribbensis]